MTFSDKMRGMIPRKIRNFMRAPGKALLHEWMTWSFSFRKKECRVPILEDWTLGSHPASVSFFRGYGMEPELREEISDFRRYVSEGMTLLDIGSHYGFYTLAALHYGGPSSRVIAVDPSPGVRNVFLANVDLAGARDRVRFIAAAVGASSQVEMLTTGAFGEYMFIAKPGRSDAIKVPGLTIPEIMGQVSWTPTHIKIDVEGYEAKVLEGAAGYLEKNRPILFFELHSRIIRESGNSPEKVLKELRRLGYRLEQGGVAVHEESILAKDICRFVCVPERGLS